VVRRLLAIQAQDLPAALLAVRIRTRSPSPEHDIVAALDAGTVVRSWPMRSTLHLVPAEDLGWMLALTTPRRLAATARRTAELGVDTPLADAAERVTRALLADRRSVPRAELVAAWEAAGLLGVPQRAYHLLWLLCQRAITCLGPMRGSRQDVVLLDEWVRAPRRLERDEALGEWMARYFAGHGPATLADARWWTGLTLTDLRAGVAVARPRLQAMVVDDVEYLMDPATPEALAAARRAAAGLHLLPAFDELLLGYADRTALVRSEHANAIAPGANGLFRPVVVDGGRAVGTWRRAGPVGARTIDAEPFDELTAAQQGAVARVGARVLAFGG